MMKEKKIEEEDTIDNNLDKKNINNEDTNCKIDNDKEENKELTTINNIKENFQDTLKVLTEKLDKSKQELNNKLTTVDDNTLVKDNNDENKKSDHLTFNDNDAVLDMGTNKETIVSAPKDIERLDKIAEINDAKRKAEEAEFDDDYDDDGPLKIHDGDIKLEIADVHDLEKKTTLEPPISLDVEVLS